MIIRDLSVAVVTLEIFTRLSSEGENIPKEASIVAWLNIKDIEFLYASAVSILIFSARLHITPGGDTGL